MLPSSDGEVRFEEITLLKKGNNAVQSRQVRGIVAFTRGTAAKRAGTEAQPTAGAASNVPVRPATGQPGVSYRRAIRAVLPSVCIVFLALNIALQYQNSRLSAALDDVRHARGPRPGGMLPQLAGQDLRGQPVVFRFSDLKGSTLLLALSARCKACSDNWPKWRSIVRRLSGRFPVVYADVADSVSDEYVNRFGAPRDRLITRIDLRTRWMHDLRDTPQTVVLGKGGRIERVWMGLLSQKDEEAITALMMSRAGI